MLFPDEDLIIFQRLVDTFYLAADCPSEMGELLVTIGACFLGTPYDSNTLEVNGEERLIINLHQFDCFTFVENVLALALMIRNGKRTVSEFQANLKRLRYRHGIVNGYASRLHYFTDWLFDNQKKGMLADITGMLGGKPWRENFCFMTTHRRRYPALRSTDTYQLLRQVEANCSSRSSWCLPLASLQSGEHAIKNGDIIALATTIEGLDVTHVGFAVRLKEDLHLFHASQEAGKVIISSKILADYLKQRETCRGIMVARAC